MRYPGGKGGAGVFQRIINLMPEHDVYIEPFLGGANIMERKRPAPKNIGLDLDADVLAQFRSTIAGNSDGAHYHLIQCDAQAYLRAYPFTGRELVYCDPPYVMSTRRGGPIYRYEYTDAEHRSLLSLLLTVQAFVMVSGYDNPLYRDMLADWRRFDFQAMTRAGPATETLWLNYEPAAVLHDFKYLGENFRERERIKRKQKRWRERLVKLPASEKMAMLQVLLELDIGSPNPAMVDPAQPAPGDT